MPYLVKEVAGMAGISVRTLHHYDQIGLLKPASVSPAGYRLYTDGDLERLQQILFFRELDFSLQEIKQILDSPNFDPLEAGYAREGWAAIMAKWEEIYTKLAQAMDKGPAHPQVQEIIGEYRQFITDNFYTCTLEIYRGLGDLYVNDERFTANIDKYRPGLAKFMREAMHIYCDNFAGTL